MLRSATMQQTWSGAFLLLWTAGIAPAAEEIGIAVGQRAPEFMLVDQSGRQESLSSILRRGKAALVFYRSADW